MMVASLGLTMPRSCTVCTHEHRHDIDSALVDRSGSYRDIAQRFGLSKDAVSRHVSGGHISRLIALAADAERAAQADTLLDRIEALQRRTLAILEAAEETGERRTALAAIAQARRNLELVGEVTKELDRTPTLNLHFNKQWLELRTVIVGALEPHPGARDAVLRAIEGSGNGNA
jgi:DNA-binding transcriptional ArsR family regulator